MLPTDATDILNTIMRLWSRWEPNVEQEGVWARQLEAMPNDPALLPRLKQAIDRAYAEQTGNWKEPKLAKIREALRSIPGGAVSEEADNVNSLTGVWAVCIESGKCVPVVQGRYQIPLGKAIEYAEQMCIDRADLYGGTWVVVPKAGDPLCQEPTMARAWADPVYAAKRAKVDDYVQGRIAKGLPLELPSMSGITDSLRNTLADDKRERTRVRGQADTFLEGGG